jgi:hypothetical protein
MGSLTLSENERRAIERIRERVTRLGAFFANTAPPENNSASEWFAYLARFKDELGNFNNDVSFFATLLAAAHLIENFDVPPFDAAEKAQGAPGLDIDVRTRRGERIIAEIKTTHPYKTNDLGAQQAKTFSKDAEKLRRESADYKFFFLTDQETFELMKKPQYRQWFQGVRVVLLPSGNEISAG